jgi:hypothetical protein
LFGVAVPEDEAPTGTPFDGGWATYDVPEVYGIAEQDAVCYRNPAAVRESAACYGFAGPSEDAPVLNPDPRYPPAFYLFEGAVGRLVPPGANAVRLMRLASVAVVSALLASAFVTLGELRRPWTVAAGVLVAVTPMVFHVGSSVNPNGVEIAAGIALWTAGTALVTGARPLDARIVTRVSIAAIVMVLARPASPVLLALVALVLLTLVDRTRARTIVRSRAVRIGAIAVGVATVFQLGWYVLAEPRYFGTPLDETIGTAEIIRFALTKAPALFPQMIGVMGHPDYDVNAVTVVLWTFMVGAVAMLGLVAGRGRMRIAILATLAATIVVPIVFDVLSARDYGFVWQSRYTLPIAVGVPILSGFAVAETALAPHLSRRAVGIVFGAAFTLAQFLAFAEFLGRYTVGVDGPILFFLHVEWSPPVPAWLLLVSMLAGLAAFCAVAFTRRPDLPGDPPTTPVRTAAPDDESLDLRAPSATPTE